MNVMEPYSIISNSPSFSISYPSKHRKEFWRSSDKRGDAWQGWYELAKDYYAAHGDLLIPRDYAVGSNSLGRWIERQRAAYNGKLACGITADHVLALNLIGMVWKLETRIPWDEWYCLAEAYYVENGHLCVPKDFVYKEKTLGAWIGEQRKRHKAGKLSQKQIDNLEKIGMLWQVGKERRSWEQSFQEAADYFAGHGDLKVPVAYRTERGTSLWQWVQSQREAYNGTRPGCLTADQIRRLTGIGMAWTVYDVAWEKMYAVAVRYYEQHGDLMVKQNYMAENGERLGQWISVQRQDYRKKAMSVELSKRIDRLNLIGMVWYAGKKPRPAASAA